jgi:leucyl/phenylalanyl-tRNA--protein transferase
MHRAYSELGRLGWVHSLEVWDGDELVGGVYGVLVGGVFTGESMFHRATDASKVALVDLCARLSEAGGRLLDVQIAIPHLVSLGAIEIEREGFRALLAAERDRVVRPLVGRMPVSRLVAHGG